MSLVVDEQCVLTQQRRVMGAGFETTSVAAEKQSAPNPRVADQRSHFQHLLADIALWVGIVLFLQAFRAANESAVDQQWRDFRQNSCGG